MRAKERDGRRNPGKAPTVRHGDASSAQVEPSAFPRIDAAPAYAPPIVTTGRAWAVVFFTHYAGLSLKSILISESDLLTKSTKEIAQEALGDFLKSSDGIDYHHVSILDDGRYLRRVDPSGGTGPSGGGHLHIKILASAHGDADSDTFSDAESVHPNSRSSQSYMGDTASSEHISSDGDSDDDDSSSQTTECPDVFDSDLTATTTCDEVGPETPHTIEASPVLSGSLEDRYLQILTCCPLHQNCNISTFSDILQRLLITYHCPQTRSKQTTK